MRLLACEDISVSRMSLAGCAMVARVVAGAIPRSSEQSAWRRARDVVQALAVRLAWLLRGVIHLRKAKKRGAENKTSEFGIPWLARFWSSMPSKVSDSQPVRPKRSCITRCRILP